MLKEPKTIKEAFGLVYLSLDDDYQDQRKAVQILETMVRKEREKMIEKIKNLSERYYTDKVNMTPELMKERVLEILTKPKSDEH